MNCVKLTVGLVLVCSSIIHCVEIDDFPVFYQFGYQVNDKDQQYGHNYQGHMEHVEGHTTTGEFKVKLPDGRLQITSYQADDNGYRPQITYTYDENDIQLPPIKKPQYVPEPIHQSKEIFTPPEDKYQSQDPYQSPEAPPPPEKYSPPVPSNIYLPPNQYTPSEERYPPKKYVAPESYKPALLLPEKYAPPPEKYAPPPPDAYVPPPEKYNPPPEKYNPPPEKYNPPPVKYTPPAPEAYAPVRLPESYVTPQPAYSPQFQNFPLDGYKSAPDVGSLLPEYQLSSYDGPPHNGIERRSHPEEKYPMSTRRYITSEQPPKQQVSDQEYFLVSLKGKDENSPPVYAILAKKRETHN